MRYRVSYPVLVGCTLSIGKRREDGFFYGKRTVEAEVAAVAERSTDIVQDSYVQDGVQHPPLRAYGGRIYRKTAVGADVLASAFSGTSHTLRSPFAQNPPLAGPFFNPAARPILQHTRFLNALYGYDTERNRKVWPSKKKNGNHRWTMGEWDRDEVDFDSMRGGLKDVSEEDVALFDRMIEAQNDRLLLIGRNLWIETPPPCFEIKINKGTGYRDDTGQYVDQSSRVVAHMSYGYLPTGPDSTCYVVRFPLDQREAALALMDELRAEKLIVIGSRTRLPEGRLDSSLSFDQEETEVRSLALALGSLIVRRNAQHGFHDMYSEAAPLFDDAGDIAALDRIEAGVRSVNFVLGETAGPASILGDALAIKKKLGSSNKRLGSLYYDGLPAVGAGIFDFMVDRALSNAPISVVPSPLMRGPA